MIFGKFSESLGSIFSDNILIFLLLGAGLYFTVKSRFVQVKYLPSGLKNTFSRSHGERGKGISPFAALATSLAAQLGTGNIVGAGTAILSGGPGAVFWMWISAFFGMASAYYEAYFSVKYREEKNGVPSGGAPFYIKRAFGGKKGSVLSGLFALVCTVGLGFTGVAVQSNSIAVSLDEAFGIPVLLSGFVIALTAGIIIFSGTEKIARVSEKTVPLAAFLYISVTLAVLVIGIDKIPHALSLIFRCAFSAEALSGAIAGLSIKKCISQGIKKGLFTNEAGMGSAPFAHALSQGSSPHFQGTLAVAGVFVDTFLMLTLTATGIIVALFPSDGGVISSLSGSEAAAASFSCILGKSGSAYFVALSVLFFAFASILGWNLFGKNACTYLFGEKSSRVYILISLLFILSGAVLNSEYAWRVTEFMNSLMVMINIPSLVLLVRREGDIRNVEK